MTDNQKIRVLTDGKDDLERGMTKLKAAGCDTSELEDFLKNLRAEITEIMVLA